MGRGIFILFIWACGAPLWANQPDCPAILTGRAAAIATAESAGLNYGFKNPSEIVRKMKRGEWVYHWADGREVKHPAILARIEDLRIPPAWQDVSVAQDPLAHIQVVGIDEAGRTQYRYHPQWNSARKETKFNLMARFGQRLPLLRKRTEHDLLLPNWSRDKVVALAVELLERSLIRVGNDRYSEENETYGLTTFEKEHVEVIGSEILFKFYGKEHIRHRFKLRDRRLAKYLSQLRELRGPRIFKYINDDGQAIAISSDDVNAYIKETIGGEFSAKNFRTWWGTVLAARALATEAAPASEDEAQLKVKAASEFVASHLRNQPAESRKSYIHPVIFQAYAQGRLHKAFSKTDDPELAALILLNAN